MRAILLASALLLSGCATTFETDRDRVLILGFGFTAAFVSNKTTKANLDKSEKEAASEVLRAAKESKEEEE